MTDGRLTKIVFETLVPGKSKKGRSRTRWIEAIRRKAENRGISWNGIRELTQDRTQWKHKYKTPPALQLTVEKT